MHNEIKKGLLGIVVDETTISQVMPEINSLTYRGYTVQELCDKCSFEEVAYLIINGKLPNKKQLKKFIKEERSNRKLSNQILKDIEKMPKKAHPMDVVRTAVSLMALEDKETIDNSPAANMRKAMRIFSKTPAAVAAFFRVRKGKKIITPKKNLSFSENFFHMCFGRVPNKEIVKAFPITEIISQNDFFDYTAKYEGLSEEITPARISEKHTKELQQTSEKIYKQMNLRGICRIDFIIMNDIPYIIEINTIPGLSEESIIPKQAKEAGISLLQLFDSCIENTLNK